MATKKEIKSMELDLERRVPLTAEILEPYKISGQHHLGNPQANKWAQWTNCNIPKKGAPASDTHQPNPTESLFRDVLDKVTAEESMTTLLQEYKMHFENAKKKVEKGRLAMTPPRSGQKSSEGAYPAEPKAPSTPTPSTWEQVTPVPSPERTQDSSGFNSPE